MQPNRPVTAGAPPVSMLPRPQTQPITPATMKAPVPATMKAPVPAAMKAPVPATIKAPVPVTIKVPVPVTTKAPVAMPGAKVGMSAPPSTPSPKPSVPAVPPKPAAPVVSAASKGPVPVAIRVGIPSAVTSPAGPKTPVAPSQAAVAKVPPAVIPGKTGAVGGPVPITTASALPRPAAAVIAVKSTVGAPVPTPVKLATSVPIIGPMTYSESDDSLIPIPNHTFNGISLATLRHPMMRRRFKYVDLFFGSMEMVARSLKSTYEQQKEDAEEKGKEYVKFTWSNRGALAENYITFCDHAALLQRQFLPNSFEPSMKGLVMLAISNGIRPLSTIPATILKDETFEIKLKDWEKGGTRYTGDQVSNTLFAPPEERRRKLEAFIRGTRGLAPLKEEDLTKSLSTVVAPDGESEMPASRGTPGVTGGRSSKRAGPGKVGAARTATETPLVNELRRLFIASRSTSVTQLHISDEFGAAIPNFVNFCATEATQSRTMLKALSYVVHSSPLIQQRFEECGGFVAMHGWLPTLLAQDPTTFSRFIDSMRFIKVGFGPTTLAVWKRAPISNNTLLPSAVSTPASVVLPAPPPPSLPLTSSASPVPPSTENDNDAVSFTSTTSGSSNDAIQGDNVMPRGEEEVVEEEHKTTASFISLDWLRAMCASNTVASIASANVTTLEHNIVRPVIATASLLNRKRPREEEQSGSGGVAGGDDSSASPLPQQESGATSEEKLVRRRQVELGSNEERFRQMVEAERFSHTTTKQQQQGAGTAVQEEPMTLKAPLPMMIAVGDATTRMIDPYYLLGTDRPR